MPTGALLGLAVIFVAVDGRAADPSGLEIRWNVPAACPDKQELWAMLAAYLPSGAPRTSAVVDVDILESESDYTATLRFEGSGEPSKRSFAGNQCERVAEAAALIIALTLDPMETALSLEPAPPGTDTSFALGARASADIGSLPGPTLGAEAVLRLIHDPFRFAASGGVWLPRLSSGAQRGRAGGEIELYAGGLSSCYDVWSAGRRTVAVAACLSFEGGVTRGRGVNVPQPIRQHAPWLAPMAGPAVFFDGLHVTSVLSVDVGAPLWRPEFIVDGFGRVFRAAPVFARASIGVAWNL